MTPAQYQSALQGTVVHPEVREMLDTHLRMEIYSTRKELAERIHQVADGGAVTAEMRTLLYEAVDELHQAAADALDQAVTGMLQRGIRTVRVIPLPQEATP